VAENLTASELRERLALERNEFDRLQRAKLWPRVSTKEGDRYAWPQALHAYIGERERIARAVLPESLSGEQLGELINRTSKTLHNYQKAGIPHRTEGKAVRYPTIEALRWCIAHFLTEKGTEAASGNGKAPTLSAQQAMEDLLRARAQRQREEIRLAADQGRVVNVDDAVRWCEELAAVMMGALQNLPAEISDDLIGLPSKAKARAAVRKGLEPAVAAVRDGVVQIANKLAPPSVAASAVDEEDDDDEDDE
jgi:phage terminase Nu1 subunit (DNA packaging protein)